ncbi:MAG TPA: hypothetical protein VJB02_05930 [Coxiellaceae bacterium]|nr:hypothetical protein [Coxiellaceae bacterium]
MITKNHYFFSRGSELKAICQNLFENSIVNFFTFERFYITGEYIQIESSPSVESYVSEAIRFYYHGHHYPALKEFLHSPQKYIVISPSVKEGYVAQQGKYKKFTELCAKNNIMHRLFIVDRSEEGKYFDLLEKFIFYFKIKAKKLINKAEKYRIYLPKFLDEIVIPHEA